MIHRSIASRRIRWLLLGAWCWCGVVTMPIAVRAEDRPRTQPSGERRPNLLERIGRFFQKLADDIERSDRPPEPGRSPRASKRGRERPAPEPSRSPSRVEPSANAGSPSPVAPPPANGVNRAPEGTPAPKTIPQPAPPVERGKTPAGSSQLVPQAGGKGPAAGGRSARPEEEPWQEFPVATPMRRSGRVKSPYPPHTELDVTGLPAGSLARDPVTGRIFRLP